MKYIVGIDEAGRGPAIGPMVYGLAAIPIDKTSILTKLGCDDSKKLTDEIRRDIFLKMKDYPELIYRTCSVSAQQISHSMNLIEKVSLNQLAFEAARSLLVDFCRDHEVECCYIDLISPAEQYAAYIQQKLPKLKLVIEAKADATYPITGAASIAAKVTRDDCLDGFHCSGYPSDSKTVDYLKTHCDQIYGFSKDVRMSWSTCEKLMEEHCKKVVWQVDREQRAKQTMKSISVFSKLGFMK